MNVKTRQYRKLVRDCLSMVALLIIQKEVYANNSLSNIPPPKSVLFPSSFKMEREEEPVLLSDPYEKPYVNHGQSWYSNIDVIFPTVSSLLMERINKPHDIIESTFQQDSVDSTIRREQLRQIHSYKSNYFMMLARKKASAEMRYDSRWDNYWVPYSGRPRCNLNYSIGYGWGYHYWHPGFAVTCW